jgi:HK97 gp10 family phage protein
MNRLEQIGHAVDEIKDEALIEAAEIVKQEMINNVSASSMNNRHIRDDIQVSAPQNSEIKVGPGKKTKWRAHFLEFGTKNMTAKPFIEPALINRKSQVLEKIADVIRRRLGI